jgi:uncharacterized protein YpmB
MVNRKRTIGKIIAGIIIVLIIIGGWLSYSYNDLVNARNDVETRYSQVDNVLQRRADLIPPNDRHGEGVNEAGAGNAHHS